MTDRDQLREALAVLIDGYPSRTYEQMGIWLEDNHRALLVALATPDQAVMDERELLMRCLDELECIARTGATDMQAVHHLVIAGRKAFRAQGEPK